ncbi:hypothetical protein HOY82DRAFT_599336 [Tuber indicum]|nr:hypothetical protein HOY82DRAFT_599336 [Tuber indicum]
MHSEAEWAKWKNASSGGLIPKASANLDYAIGSQAGSGKLFFLSYILVQWLVKAQPTAFRINNCKCYLFDEMGSDDKLTDAGWNCQTNTWFVVLAASPAKVKASYQWVKDPVFPTVPGEVGKDGRARRPSFTKTAVLGGDGRALQS